MLRTILITGASSGIGAATAIAFAKPNNRLILVSRKNREGLKKIEDEGRERGAEVLSILADVSDYESCKSLLTEANEHFGPIDLLINNAGISHIGLFQDMTPDRVAARNECQYRFCSRICTILSSLPWYIATTDAL